MTGLQRAWQAVELEQYQEAERLLDELRFVGLKAVFPELNG